MVDFPEPEAPAMAVVVELGRVRVKEERTGCVGREG